MKQLPTLREKVSQISIGVFLLTIILMIASFYIYSVKKTKIAEDHMIEKLTSNLQSQVNVLLPSYLLPEQTQGIQLILEKIRKAEALDNIMVVPDIQDVLVKKAECKANVDYTVCFNKEHTETLIIVALKESGEVFGYLMKSKKNSSPDSLKNVIQIAGLFIFVLGFVFTGVYLFITSLLRRTLPASIDTLVNMIESELKGTRESVELPFRELEDLKTKILDVLDRYNSTRDQALVGQLTSGIMHDIKTPLQSVVTAMHLADEQAKDSPKRLARLENAQLMNKINLPIICDIIETTLDGSREIKVTRKDNYLDRTLSESISRSLEMATQRNVKLETNLAISSELFHDSVQFSRVISNLLKNAIEATDESTIKTVKISSSENSQNYQVRIEDSGQGIQSPEKIFKAFQTTKSRGTGLGLVISKKIVEAHGGSLSASRSEELGGAAMIVNIPKVSSGAIYEQSF